MTTAPFLESKDVRAAIDAVVPVIEQQRDEAERQRHLPEAVVAAMREAGLLQLWMPKEYGGSEVDLPVFLEAAESLSRVDTAAGWIFATAAGGPLLTAFVSPESAKEVYANGPNVLLPPRAGARRCWASTLRRSWGRCRSMWPTRVPRRESKRAARASAGSQGPPSCRSRGCASWT